MTRRPISVARMLSERARTGEPRPNATEAVGGIFEGLQKLVEGLQDAVKQAGSASDAEKKLVFGYSVKVGPMGTTAERFGNAPETAAEPATAAVREPIVDVFEEDDAILVVAEVPGAEEDAVTARIEDGALLIESPAPHAYRKRIPLPGPVDGGKLELACRNGILEIRLPRQ